MKAMIRFDESVSRDLTASTKCEWLETNKQVVDASRTRLNLLCFDGRLVTTAASSGRRPRVKHRNNQQQNTKR